MVWFLMKIFKTLFTTLFLFVLVAQSQPPLQAENDAIFYKITGNNIENPSYLFGTIHLMCDDEEFSRALIAQAVASTDRVLMEVDLSNPGELLKKSSKALSKDVKPVKPKPFPEVLSKEESNLVIESLRKYSNFPLAFMKKLPMEMIIVLLSASPKTMGCSTSVNSYELKIAAAAKSNQKPIAGLETIEQQFALLPKSKRTNNKNLFLKFISEIENRKAKMINLRKIYFEQNANQLFELTTSQLEDDPKFQAKLLDERNQAWIPKIEKRLENESLFIAVGAAHLGGDKGLLKLLRERGYTLEPIKLKKQVEPQRSLQTTLPIISFSSTSPNSRLSELSSGLSPNRE